MSSKEEKKIFRDGVLAETEALPEEYIHESNIKIAENFLALPEYKSSSTVFAYLGVGREPATADIINAMLADGKTVALPISYKGGIMVPHVIKSLDEMIPGKFGIPAPPEDTPALEPGEVDLIIVPGVTFDEKGYRMGRGGGYYDRYLEKTRAFSVGIARSRLVRPVPVESHDMGVNCLVTDSGAVYFK